MATKKRLLPMGLALLVVVAVGLAAAACGGGEDIALAYTYTAGGTWTHEITMTEVTSGDLGATETTTEPVSVETVTKARMTTTVDEVTSDGATLSVKLETLEMTVDGEAQDVTAEEPQEITMTVDKAGKVVSTDAAGETGAASSFLESGTMDASAFSSQLANMVFPEDGTAKVGEEWKTTDTVPLGLEDQQLTITTTSKLTGVATENGRGVATIEYTTTIPMDFAIDLGELFSAMMGGMAGTDDSSAPSIAFVMTMGGKIEFSGIAKVDTATGQTISSDSDGVMDLTMEYTEAPEEFIPADQRGPFSMNASMTMNVVEAK
jgi:hypothetical protein